MAAKQLMLPANRAFNSNGLAISGAQAKLYLSGGLTPANFFADSGLITSLGATLTANGAGRFPTAYGDSTVGYRLRTLDSDGAILDDIDPYFFGLTTGVDGANASIAVGTTTTGAAGSSATVSNSGTGTNAILNFTIPIGPQGANGNGALDVKGFGAVGNGVTDDHAAFQAAINLGAATGVAIYVPRGTYRISALLTSTAPIHLFGDFSSQDATGTATPAALLGSSLYFDAGVGGLLLYYVTNLTAAGSPTIYPSAAGSIIERIQLYSAGAGAAHSGIYGIEARATCTLRDVGVRGFGDHGIVIRGSTSGGDGVVYGNVNGSLLENLKSISNAGAGLRISGNDANSILVDGGLFQANTGYGIDNDSFQGCTFNSPVVEGNTAGAIITRRPTSALNLYAGIDHEGGTSVLGTNDTVIGGPLSQGDWGQISNFYTLLYARRAAQVDGNLTAGTNGGGNSHVFWGTVSSWNGIVVRSGSVLQLNDAGNSVAFTLSNDGTNLNAGITPFSAGSYKVAGTLVINSSGVLQAVAFPALTGDVTTTAGALAATIPAGTVTLAKMANMATASLIYRKTAGSGAPEVNTLATLKTDLGLTGTNSGDQTITLTSDVTGTGTGSFATTIAANAVTFAKFQQVAASSLVGNPTGSLANAQGITLAGGLAFSGTTITVGALTPTSLASTGAVTSSSATAGIGYGSGSRGTVTQATSKATGATSNTVVTDITLNAAALASATTVSFVFTNSAITANDTLILNHVTTGTFGSYTLNAHGFSAGSCTIDVRNISAGSLSEAIVIRAVLVKGG